MILFIIKNKELFKRCERLNIQCREINIRFEKDIYEIGIKEIKKKKECVLMNWCGVY